MKLNNATTFLGLTALWLVLASSSLCASIGSSMDTKDDPEGISKQLFQYLELLEKEFDCNAMYFSTTDKEDRSENCLIYELENIDKTCSPKVTNTVDDNVSELVHAIGVNAKTFFPTYISSISSCEGYEQKNVTVYINKFKTLIKRKNAMQLMQS